MKQTRFPFLKAGLSMWLLAGVAHAQSADDLAVAIASGDAARAQSALSAGVDVNANLGEGRTPLITAVMMNATMTIATG